MDFDIVDFLEKQYGHMPGGRADKVRNLFDLATNCNEGDIVELGTFHGLGTAALCLGLRMSGHDDTISVYTVDNYIHRRGWFGEEYKPNDLAIFRERMITLELIPTLIIDSIEHAAEGWTKPIGVLFWDAGTIRRMLNHITAWEEHVLVGGKIYLHDTNSGLLGSDETIEYLKSIGYKVIKDVPGHKILEKGLPNG